MRINSLGNIGAIAGRKLAIALTAVCVLAAGLVAAPTPAAGQSDVGIRIYGNSPPDHFPSLHGPADGWWRVKNPPGQYGLNHHGEYAYTYGNSDPEPSNWASWSFSVPDSDIYDVWVWVPANNATAQVNYKLHLTGCIHPLGVFPTLDQQNYTGWVQIGRVALDRIQNSPSNELFLEVLDNEVSDAHESLRRRSIGVSVALMERNFNMGWEDQTNSTHLLTDESCQQSPQVDLSEPRNVRVAAGDGSLVVSWDEPARTVGLIDYDVAHRCAGSTKWTEWRPEDVSTQRSATITGLANGVECRVRVWAHNDGLNAQSGGYAYASGTPQAARQMVRISWGSDATGRPNCADAGQLCRNLSYVLSGFGAGPYRLSCFEKGSSTPGWSGSWSGPSAAHRACYFGRGDGQVWVSVDGVESNRLQAPSAAVPGVPRDLSVVPGERSLALSWSPPASSGSAPVTGYAVSWGGGSVTVSGTSHTVRGLAASTAYTVTVAAVNREGRGRAASATATTTGADAPALGSTPDMPRLQLRIAGSPGSRTLQASWTKPADDGEAPITGYEVTIRRLARGAQLDRSRVAATVRRHRFSGLLDNALYLVSVAARNEHGTGTWTRKLIKTPAAVAKPPAAPEGLRVWACEKSGKESLCTSWREPDNDGGAPITGYEVTFKRWRNTIGPKTYSETVHQVHLTGRVEGLIYEVRVAAKNKHGWGPLARTSYDPSPDHSYSGCLPFSKFGVFKVGTVFGTHVVRASASFVTIDGSEIKHLDRGGNVSARRRNGWLETPNLSPYGCSWITEGAKADRDSKVYNNALVKGHAEITGNARVYGNAVIDGAKIYGKAQVYGNAMVSGRVHVGGDAEVYGNLELDSTGTRQVTITSGKWNDGEEFMRVFEEAYKELSAVIRDWLRRCEEDGTYDIGTGSLWDDVQTLIALSGGVSAQQNRIRNQIKLQLSACSNVRANTRVLDAIKPGASDLLPLGLNHLVTLYNLFDAQENINKIVQVTMRLEQWASHVRNIYEIVKEKRDNIDDFEGRVSALGAR